MKIASMCLAIADYLSLVCVNLYFVLGIVGGYLANAIIGGRIVSIATGVVVGIFVHELVKYISFR